MRSIAITSGLMEAKNNGTGIRLELKYDHIKSGGFLPLLLAGIDALGSLIGTGSAIANTVINKKAKDKELEEQQRHNKTIEGKGSQFQYYISGKVVREDNNNDLNQNNTVHLIDNFPAFLFSEIEVRKHSKVIDQIECVGVTSTIKGIVSFSIDRNGPTIISGFESNYKANVHSFSVVGNLSNFGLGFFKDVKNPIFKGGFELIFTRNDDHFAIHKEAADPRAKIIIEEFLIRVPIITYDDMSKLQLINDLKELSQQNEYLFSFRSWQCIPNKNISGKTLNLDITNIYRNVHNPLFGFVAFQTNKDSNYNQDQNCSDFDHCKVKNIWFEVNNKRYPEELLDLDWDKEKYAIAYDMLTHYKKVFVKTQNNNIRENI
ncbi:unnamed protein product [Psylliodes chrysocephalus]|uniref:Double jelly roll-like domain-containing protein n=1 Tax=Psylliodes chrysocephalus TaxID=3402493 RepID=A0A9P0DFM1_9CUCU|nr:unnamed protein product [Psylliodes chrysocephala]